MKNRLAIVTGATGQDGYYLAKRLLLNDYKVVGVQRRTSSPTDWRLKELKALPGMDTSNLVLESGDITDYSSIARLIDKYQPDEFYNLAAQSQVWHSFRAPLSTAEITGLGAFNCLEAIRQLRANSCKFYQASSSEMFGNSLVDRDIRTLNEKSPMIPRSPYGAAKLFAHNMVHNYREAYEMFAVGGVLFNHESPYRGTEFLTRKVTHNIAQILAKRRDSFSLGNLDAKRDWGHAEDYMNAAWLMLQQETPQDYVIATGEAYSVRDFLTLACLCVGIKDWSRIVRIDSDLVRPTEVDVLVGDSSKARKELGWAPFYDFSLLVYDMMKADLQRENVSGALVSYPRALSDWYDYLEKSAKSPHNKVGGGDNG